VINYISNSFSANAVISGIGITNAVAGVP